MNAMLVDLKRSNSNPQIGFGVVKGQRASHKTFFTISFPLLNDSW